MRPPLRVVVAVFFIALMVAWAALAARGSLSRTTGSDGFLYAGLARGIAEGRGYLLDASPWPTTPYTGRLPLWPLMLAPAFAGFPGANENLILHITGIFLQAFCAALLAAVTWRIWGDTRAALLAGLGFAVYLPALALIDGGFSEHAYLFVTLAGIMLLMSERRLLTVLGALLMGLGPLARSNSIVLPVFLAGAAFLMGYRPWRRWREFALLAALYFLPMGIWLTRNYAITGIFPLISTDEGETFYGGNNALVANDLRQWGYWVFPDLIPGETPKLELAKHMGPVELNAYYRSKGMSYMKANFASYPLLLLGRFVRSFVTIPWVPSPEAYLGFSLRAVVLYGGLFFLIRRTVKSPLYGAFLWAVFSALVISILIYFGMSRLVFPLEVFLIPVVAAGMSQSLRREGGVTESVGTGLVSSS